MGDFYRKINEDGEPRSTAEEELKKLLGHEGHEFFNKFFPPERIMPEIKAAKEFAE